MPGAAEADSLWHSFDLGRAHIVGVSTEAFYYQDKGVQANMMAWFEANLKAANTAAARAERPWIVVHFHRPIYSTNYGDASNPSSAPHGDAMARQHFESLLYQYGVDLVFSGHVHSQERTWPVYNGTILNGTTTPGRPYHNGRAPVHIVSGNPSNAEGASVRLVGLQPWTAWRSLAYGYSHMDIVNATHLHVDIVSTNLGGAIVDEEWLVKDGPSHPCPAFGSGCQTAEQRQTQEQQQQQQQTRQTQQTRQAQTQAQEEPPAASLFPRPEAVAIARVWDERRRRDHASAPADQVAALWHLFETLGGEEWRHRSGWARDGDPCAGEQAWYGVSCVAVTDQTIDSVGGGVTAIQLPQNNLRGDVTALLLGGSGERKDQSSSFAALMRTLQLLDLSDNFLTGSIGPTSVIWSGPNLHSLYFDAPGVGGNQYRLKGGFPDDIGTTLPNLRHLSVQRHLLSGSIPPSFGYFPCRSTSTQGHGGNESACIFWMQGNELTGKIPMEMCGGDAVGMFAPKNAYNEIYASSNSEGFGCPRPCITSSYSHFDPCEEACIPCPSTSILPGAPLATALQAAADAGAAHFAIPPGDYNFSATPLRLQNAHGLTIDGASATIWFGPGGGLNLQNATDVFVRGLTIDYYPTVAQGVVVAADLPGKTFTADFDQAFLAPTAAAAAADTATATSAASAASATLAPTSTRTTPTPTPSLAVESSSADAWKVAFWDPSTRHMVRNDSLPAAINIFSDVARSTHLGPGAGKNTERWRLPVEGNMADWPLGAKKKNLVTVFPRDGHHSYVCIGCKNVTLDGVRIFGGSAMGVVETGGGGGHVYRNFTLARRPLTRGSSGELLPAAIPRLLASNADGFHSSSNDVGPTIINSTISFTGDDLANICSGEGVYLGTFGGRASGGEGGEGEEGEEGEEESTGFGGKGVGGGNPVMAIVDVSGTLLSAKAGDEVSFYHLNTIEFLGKGTLSAPPTSLRHNAAAVAAMRSGYAKMQAPPYDARFVQEPARVFASGFPVAIVLDGGVPVGVTPYWSLVSLGTSDNAGAVVKGSVLSDGYARAFMIKGKDAVYEHNTFRRAGGIHVGVEQAWLEGDPGIGNVTVAGNRFEALGVPAVTVDSTIPPGRGITVVNNTVNNTGGGGL